MALGLGSLLYSGGCAAELNDLDAVRLVQAVHADRVLQLGMPRVFFPRMDEKEPFYAVFARCMREGDLGPYTDTLVLAVMTLMSAREIRAALDFYESPVGRKYALEDFRFNVLNLGVPVPVPEAQSFNDQETALVQAFLKTPAGTKFTVSNISRQPLFGDRLLFSSLERAAKCKPDMVPPWESPASQVRHR